MKTILVTGGAGFIGSHLCRRLVATGQNIICMDNFFTGSRMNIQDLINKPNFRVIEQDVMIPIQIAADEIYNLACPASPVHYQYDPIATFKTSVIGAINMLELAREHRSKILQASTSEVYGDPSIHPQVESYWGNVNPIGVRSCYDEGKRAAETLFFDYYRKHGIKIKIVRIFNTYGPSMHPQDGRVVSNFIVQALTGQSLTVYGEGRQTRSFCYIDDLVEGLIQMMNSADAFVGPVNLGNPAEFTIAELVELIQAKTKSESDIIFKPLPLDDPQKRRPDIELARQNLDWNPQITLDEGLERTISYFKELDLQAQFNAERPNITKA